LFKQSFQFPREYQHAIPILLSAHQFAALPYSAIEVSQVVQHESRVDVSWKPFCSILLTLRDEGQFLDRLQKHEANKNSADLVEMPSLRIA
jgi:hypothetical protein